MDCFKWNTVLSSHGVFNFQPIFLQRYLRQHTRQKNLSLQFALESTGAGSLKYLATSRAIAPTRRGGKSGQRRAMHFVINEAGWKQLRDSATENDYPDLSGQR